MEYKAWKASFGVNKVVSGRGRLSSAAELQEQVMYNHPLHPAVHTAPVGQPLLLYSFRHMYSTLDTLFFCIIAW